MTLGNHEWDGGDEQLGEFLQNLTFPIVSCNVKSEYEGLNKTIKNYHIFDKYDLAVIGATTDTTPSISNVGDKTTFLDATEEVQKAIYEIRNTTDIRRIVALTHIGYEEDQKLAKNTEGLSLIIGGHSHTLLGDMEKAEGKYPTIIEDASGKEVFIVTAYRWGEYLGSIDLTFDEDGRALKYHGAPIHMTNSTEFDKDLQEKIESWRGPFEKYAAEVLGTTENELDQATCQKGDCLLGQVMCDAMLEYRRNLTENSDAKPADFALINSGGVRATIDAGEITRGEVLTSFPFGNAIVELTYSGKDLRKVLEGCVSQVNQFNDKKVSSWFQVSDDIKIEFNPDNEPGNKLVSVMIGDKPLDDKREDYRVVTLDFLAGGGDNIFVATKDFITLETQAEVLEGYITSKTPLTNELEDRVVKVDKQAGNGGNGGNGGKNETGDGKNETGGNDVPPKSGATGLVSAGVSMVFIFAAAMVAL
jgi:5'-nucleotidase